MNRAALDPIADAVLYEGYILYPYRPSVKNRQRWTFGGLFPASFGKDRGGEASGCRTECLVEASPGARFEAVVRFLHLTDRHVGALDRPLDAWPAEALPHARRVESLNVNGRRYHSWQEAEERSIETAATTLAALADRPRRESFAFPGRVWTEPIRDAAGRFVGVVTREQLAVEGCVETAATEVGDGRFRVSLVVENTTTDASLPATRAEAALRALVSTHAMLGVSGGSFISLSDPPDGLRDAAARCRNEGLWPVLVGDEDARDAMLASPIILPDFPRVAPESPGDFFDGTEIDEMLTLRVMTLTDAEKREMAAIDGRAGALLARVETMAREQMRGLHGAVRGMKPAAQGDDHA
jgi:hydrogenase maturation protease